jgi:Flp pilus assembly protein TadD
MLTIKNPPRNSPSVHADIDRMCSPPVTRRAHCKSFNPFDLFNLFNICLLLFIVCGCTPAGPKAFVQGAKLIDQGKYSQAVEKLKLATSLIPTNAQAWNYLGLAYHHAGQLDEAEKTYRRALLIDHDLSEAHYNLGCLFLEEKKNDAAKTEFIAYTLRRANSPDALLKLGSAQLRLGELAAAEKTFQDALRLSPQNAEALNGLGCLRVHQRARASEAPGYFRAALKAQTNYPPAILNWAIFAQQSQDKRFALQKYHEYVSLKPPPENVPAVKVIVAQLEQEFAPAPAPRIATNPIPPRVAPTNLTRPAAVQKSEPSTASAKSVAPPVPRTATNNTKLPPAATPRLPADTDVVKLSPEPAVKPAQDVSPLSTPTTSAPTPNTSTPDTATSAAHAQAERLFAEGRRAQQAQRFTDAINSYRAATEQDPAYFEAFYNLALATADAGDSQAAIGAYESALALRPDSLEARYNLSLALKQNNDFARAAGELEKLLQKYPTDTRSHLALGNLYAQQLREPAKARPHYLKVLETDPHNAQADKIRFWLTSNL